MLRLGGEVVLPEGETPADTEDVEHDTEKHKVCKKIK